MITNEQFRTYLEGKLGITLFADYGEFERSYREHNDVIVPTCGILKMQPMTVTPLQGLFLASATGTIEIPADVDKVALIRATIDNLAATCNGETETMRDAAGRTYMLTFSYSTAYVGVERTAPNNTGKMIPVSMTMYCSIIQNGVSSCDVKVEFDGNPVFVTEFAVSHQRVADSYATENGMTKAAILQSVRSFDFISPLLSSPLGEAYRAAIFGAEGNEAHCLSVTLDGKAYHYLCVFGNTSATVRAPQNVGCNISLLEGDPDTLEYSNRWLSKTASSTCTLSLPATRGKYVVFWGDGATQVWNTHLAGASSLYHKYADGKSHTVRYFRASDGTAARSVAASPDQTYEFCATATAMTATLFTSDYVEGADGYWRRNCTVDWGDGTVDTYNTMNSSPDELPSGLTHTYEAVGVYTVKVYNAEEPLWVSV